MSERLPGERPPARLQNGMRVLGHSAVVIGILAVLAAAFALSYDAVRDIALAAGVPATLARIYPGIFDAVFLVACAAALMLRDARWWARLYAWLSVLVTGGLIGAADAYHAMGLRLPHRIAAGTVAALPWALVMLGFSLWLSMLRHARTGRAPAAPDPEYQSPSSAPALALAAAPAARGALPAAEPAPEPERPGTQEPVSPAQAHDDLDGPSPADQAGPADQADQETEGADQQAAEPSPADSLPAPAVPVAGAEPAPLLPVPLLSAPVPADVAAPDEEPSATPRPPARFERVRSTPTPPER